MPSAPSNTSGPRFGKMAKSKSSSKTRKGGRVRPQREAAQARTKEQRRGLAAQRGSSGDGAGKDQSLLEDVLPKSNAEFAIVGVGASAGGLGGITLVQEPNSAKYDGMPRAAMATGAVDLVLPPQEIANELYRISRHPLLRSISVRRPGDDLDVNDDHLSQIFTILRNATSVDF